MRLKFRGEVWPKYINLGVISLEMIFKAVKLDEIIREWVWIGKRKVQALSPGQDQTAIAKTLDLSKAYTQTSLNNP